VQLQNLRIDGVHARDQVAFTDNHPDILQTWAGPARLLVDRMTGSTDYQAFFMSPNQFGTQPQPELFDFRRINIHGGPTARYLFWRGTPFPLRAADIWMDSPARTLATSLWPDPEAWPGARMGTPATGDYVPEGVAGIGYAAPGYL
jgi:hypothetical protein